MVSNPCTPTAGVLGSSGVPLLVGVYGDAAQPCVGDVEGRRRNPVSSIGPQEDYDRTHVRIDRMCWVGHRQHQAAP